MLALLLAAALALQTLPGQSAPDRSTPDQTAPDQGDSFSGVVAARPAQQPPTTPELWHGARAGMTPDQVKALFPEGRDAPPTTFGFPPTPNAVEGGGAAGYAVDEEVFGHPAIATYYFNAGRLLEVVVDVQNLRLRHTRDNVQIAREVQSGLLGFYGPAKVCVDSDRKGLARLDCRWTPAGIQVGLSYVDYGGLSPTLDVAVRSAAPKKRFAGAVFGRRGGH